MMSLKVEVPRISITPEAEEDDDNNYLSLVEALTDIEDLELGNEIPKLKTRTKRRNRSRLMIKVNNAVGDHTDVEDMEGSDVEDEDIVIHKNPIEIDDLELDSGTVEEMCKVQGNYVKGKNKLHSQVSTSKSKQLVRLDAINDLNSLTDVEDMYTSDDEDLLIDNIPEVDIPIELLQSKDNTSIYDNMITQENLSSCATPSNLNDQDENTTTKYLSMPVYAENNVTDFEVVSDDETIKSNKKHKRIRKRRPKGSFRNKGAVTDIEDIDLSAEEAKKVILYKPTIRELPQKQKKFYQSVSVLYDTDNEDDEPMLVRKKSTLKPISQLLVDQDGLTDLDDLNLSDFDEYEYDNTELDKQLEKSADFCSLVSESNKLKGETNNEQDMQTDVDDYDTDNDIVTTQGSDFNIKIGFMNVERSSPSYLSVPLRNNDPITDEEILDSDDEKKITIPVAFAREIFTQSTDEETFSDDEMYSFDTSLITLPKVTRELIRIKENRFGKPTVLVQDLDECDISIGMNCESNEETDTEYVADENLSYLTIDTPLRYPTPDLPILEGGHVITHEEFRKKLGHVPLEPLTDTEDIYLDKKQRKNKSKKSRVYKEKLEVEDNLEPSKTDVEDLLISDSEKNREVVSVAEFRSDVLTDVEHMNMSEEEIFERPFTMTPDILRQMESDNVISVEGNDIFKNIRYLKQLALPIQILSPALTDTEDIDLSADEDSATNFYLDASTPIVLRKHLTEISSSSVFSHNTKKFDLSGEFLYLKGGPVCEGITDMEELDLDSDKAIEATEDFRDDSEWSTEGSGEQGKIASAPSLTPDAAKSDADAISTEAVTYESVLLTNFSHTPSIPKVFKTTSYTEIDAMLDKMFLEVGDMEENSLDQNCINTLELVPSNDALIEVPIKKSIKVPKCYASTQDILISDTEDIVMSKPETQALTTFNDYYDLISFEKDRESNTVESMEDSFINIDEDNDTMLLLQHEDEFTHKLFYDSNKTRASSESLSDTSDLYPDNWDDSPDQAHFYEPIDTSNYNKGIWWEGTYRNLSIVPEEDEENISLSSNQAISESISVMDPGSSNRNDSAIIINKQYTDDDSDSSNDDEQIVRAEIKLLLKTNDNGRDAIEVRSVREFLNDSPDPDVQNKETYTRLVDYNKSGKPIYTLQRLFVRTPKSETFVNSKDLSKCKPELIPEPIENFPLKYSHDHSQPNLYANYPFYPCYKTSSTSNNPFIEFVPPDSQSNPTKGYCDWIPQSEAGGKAPATVLEEKLDLNSDAVNISEQVVRANAFNDLDNQLEQKASTDEKRQKRGIFVALKSMVSRSLDLSDSETEKSQSKDKKQKKQKGKAKKEAVDVKIKPRLPTPDKEIDPHADIPFVETTASDSLEKIAETAKDFVKEIEQEAEKIINQENGPDATPKSLIPPTKETKYELNTHKDQSGIDQDILKEQHPDSISYIVQKSEPDEGNQTLSKHMDNIPGYFSDDERMEKIKMDTHNLIQSEINFQGWSDDKNNVPSQAKVKSQKVKQKQAKLFGFLSKKSTKDVDDSDDEKSEQTKSEIIEKHDEESSKEKVPEGARKSGFFKLFKKNKKEDDDTMNSSEIIDDQQTLTTMTKEVAECDRENQETKIEEDKDIIHATDSITEDKQTKELTSSRKKSGIFTGIFSKKEKSSIDSPPVSDTVEVQCTNIDDKIQHDLDETKVHTSKFLQQEVGTYQLNGRDESMIEQEESGIIRPEIKTTISDKLESTVTPRSEKKKSKSRPRSMRESSESGDESDGSYKKYKFNIFGKKKDTDVEIIKEAKLSKENINATSTFLESEVLNYEDSKKMPVGKTEMLQEEKKKSGILGVFSRKKENEEALQAKQNEAAPASEELQKAECNEKVNVIVPPPQEPTTQQTIENINATTQFLRTEVDTYEDGVLSVKDSILAERVKIPEIEIERTGISEAILPKKVDSVVDDKDTFEGIIDSVENKIAGKDNGVILKELPEPTHIDTTSVFLQTEVDEYEDIKPAIHTPVSTEIQKKFEKKVKDDTTEKKISGILGVIFSKKKEPAIEVEAKSLKTELNGGEKLSQTITSLDSPDTTEKCLGVTGNDETEAFLQLEVEKYHDVKLIAHPPASDSNKISKSDMVVEKKSKDDGIKEEKPGLLGSIFSKKEKSSKKTKSVEPEIVDNMYKPEDTNVTDDSIKQIEDTSNFLQTEVSLYEDKKLDVITEQKDILDPSLPSGENDVQTPIILRKKDKKSRPRSLRESSESGEESDGTNKKRKFNIFSKKKQPDNVDVITEQYSEVIKADEVLSDSKISSPLLQSETQQPSEEIQITEPKSIDQNEPKLATKKKYKKSSSESGEDSDTCSKSSGFRLFSRLKKPDVPKVSITKAESSEGGMATSVAVIRDIENTTNFLQTEIENYEDVKPVITTDLDELSQSDDKTDIKKRSKKPKRESSESGDESDGSTKKSRFSIFKKCRKDEVDVEPPIKEAQSKEELLHSEYFEIPLDSEVIVHDTVTAPKSDYSVVESTVEDKTAKKKGIFGIFGKSGKHNEEDLQRNVTVEEENKFSQSVIENEFPQTAKNEQSTVINKEETEKQISSTSDFLLNEVKNYEPVSSVMKQETDAKGSPKKRGIFSIFTKKASKDKYEQRFVDDSDTSSPQDLNKIESSIPCTVDTCTTEELAEPTTDATKKVTFEEMSLIVDPIKSTAEFLSAEQIQDSHQRGTVHPIVVKAEILDSAQQVVMKEIEYKCNLEESGDVEGATEKLSSQDKNFEQIIEPQGLSLVSGTIRVTTSITHLDDQVKQLEEKISQQVNIVGNKNNIGKVLVSTTKEYQTLPTVPDTELKIIDEAIMDQRDIETYLEQECISEITDKIERIPEVYEAKIQTKIIDTPALSSDNIKISADTPEFAPTNIDSTAQEVIDTATEKTISIISDLKSKVDDVNDMLKRKETIEYPGDSVVHEEVCATKQEETETPQKQDEQKGFFTKLSTKFGKKTKTGEDEKVLKSADKKKTKSKGIFGKIGDKFSLSTDTAEAKVKEIDTQIDSALTDVVQGVSTLKDNLQKDISQETSNIEKKTENVIDILGSELDMKRDIVAEHATKLSASIGDITKNGRTDAEEVVVLDRKGQENVRDSVLDTRSLPHQGEEKLDTGIHQGLLDAKSVIGDLATEILSEVGDVKILSTPPNELTVHERKAETEVDMEAKNASLDSTKSSGPGFRFTSILQRSDKVIEKAGAIVQGVQETQKTEDAKNITIESVKIVKDEGVRLIGDISTKDDIKTTASEIEKSSVSAITQGQELISNKVAEAGKVLQLKSEEVQNLGYQEFDKIDHTVTGLKEDMHKMKVEAAGVFGNMSDETKKEVKEVSERASKIKQSVTQEITRKSKHAVEEIEDAASGIKSTAISAKERSLEVAAAAVADAKSTLDSAKDSSTGYKEVAMGKLVELQDAACQEIGGIAQKIGSVKEITCESVKLVESSAVSNLENIKSSSKGMIATARADVELGVESTKQLSKDSKESAEHKLKKLQGDAIDKIGDTIQEIKHVEENVIKSTKDKVAESAIGFIGTDYKDVASGVKSTAISAKERSAEVAAAALTDAKSALVSAKDSTTGYKEVVIGKLEELQDAASQEIGGIAQKIGSVKETTCKTVKLVESSAVNNLENIKDSSKEIIASTRADVDLGVESTKQLSKDCKESVELKLKKLQGDAIDKIGDTIHEIKHMKENVIKSTEDKVAESAIGSIGTDCKDVASAIKSTAISVKERSAEVAAAAVADAKSALDSAKDSNTGYKEVVMGKLEELQDAANQEIGGIAQKIGSVKETTGETVKLVESSAVSNLENIKDCSKEMIASARADAELGVESTKQLSKDCKESAELKLKNLHEGVIDNIGDTSQQIKHMEENIVKSTKDNVDVMKHVAETAIGSVGTDYKNVASGVKSTAISVKEKSAEVAAAAVTNTKSAVDSAKDLTTDYKEVVLEKCVDIQKAATQEIGNIKETTNKTGSETAKFVESSAISSLENIEFSSKEVVATATSHAKLAVDSTKKLTKDCKDSTEFKLMELQGRASDKFGDTVLELKHIEEDVDKSTKDNVEVMANVAKSGVGSAGTDYKEAVVGKLVDLREAATQEIGTIKDAANKIACENVKSVGSSAISNLENVKEGSEKTISDVKLAVDSSRKLTKDCKESAELKLIELQAGTIDKVGGTMQGIKHMEEEVVKSTKDKVEVVENVALDIKSGAMSGLQRAKENSKNIVEAGVGDVRSVIDTSITDCKDAAKDKLTTLHEGTTQEMKNKEKVTVKKMDDTTGAIKTAASEIKSTAIHTLESAFGCSDEAAAAAKFDVLSSVDSTNKSITDRKDAVEEKLKKQKDLSKRKIDEFGESLVNVQKDVLAEKNKIVTQFSAEAESMKEDREKTDEVKCVMGGIVGDQLKKGKGVFKQLPSELGAVKKGKGVFKQLPSELGAVKSAITEKVTDKVTEEASEISTHVTRGLQDVKQKSDDVLEAGESSLKRTGELSEHHIHNIGDEWKEVEAQVVGSKQRASKMFEKLPTTSGFKIDKMISEDIESKKAANKLTGKYAHSQESVKLIPDAVAKTERNMEFEEKLKAEPEEERRMDSIGVTFSEDTVEDKREGTSHSPNRKPLFRLESDDDSFDFDISNRRDSTKSNILENFSEQNLEALVSSLVTDEVIRTVNVDGLEHKLDELEKVIVNVEKTEEQIKSAEEKLEGKLKRVERKFERMASEVMDNETQEAKSSNMTTPEIEEKNENDFRKIVSQLSREEVSDFQTDYASLWDEQTFSHTDEWDSKTPESQADVVELPQGEIIYMAPVTLNKDNLVNKAGIEVDVIPRMRSPYLSPKPRRKKNSKRARSELGFHMKQSYEDRGSLPDLFVMKKGSIMDRILTMSPQRFLSSSSGIRSTASLNNEFLNEDNASLSLGSSDSLSKGLIMDAVVNWLNRSGSVEFTNQSFADSNVSTFDDDASFFSERNSSRNDNTIPDILVSEDEDYMIFKDSSENKSQRRKRIEISSVQLTKHEITALPQPKPRTTKLSETLHDMPTEQLDLDDTKTSLDLGTQEDSESVVESYMDRKKFWENVCKDSEHESKGVIKRMSLHEEKFKITPTKRTSIHEVPAHPPVPKPRSTVSAAPSFSEVEAVEPVKIVSEYQSSYGDPSRKSPPQIQEETKSLEKSDSIDSDNENSGQCNLSSGYENTGYISDSGDVEHYISDSEIEDRVPQIRERQMSMFQPPARRTIYERSCSLPTEDLYEVSAQSILLRKQYFEDQIKKDMVDDELMTDIEEEHSQEHKMITQLKVEDDEDEPSGVKSVPDNISFTSEEGMIRDSINKMFSKEEKDEALILDDYVERKSVTNLSLTEEAAIKDIQDFEEIVSIEITHKTDTHKPTSDTMEFKIQSSTESDSIFDKESMGLNDNADDTTSKPSDSMEVHVDKSEIEDSEKMTDLDVTDLETKSSDSLNAELSPKTLFNQEEIPEITISLSGKQRRISEESDESLERTVEVKPVIAEKSEVSSPVHQPEEHVPDIIWEVSLQSQATTFDERTSDLPVDRHTLIEKDDDLSSSVRDESDLGSEIHQDHSESAGSERRSESQADIEKLILESLHHQKISPEEARIIASELIADIEAEIHKRQTTPDYDEPPAPEYAKNQVSDYLRQLAEAKGLDSREVQLVQSVLARKQRELTKLSRGDTQASSIEITDEELRYSGTDYSPSASRAYILEEQIDQLEAEKVLEGDFDDELAREIINETRTKESSVSQDYEVVDDDGIVHIVSETDTSITENIVGEKTSKEHKDIIVEEDETVLDSVSEDTENITIKIDKSMKQKEFVECDQFSATTSTSADVSDEIKHSQETVTEVISKIDDGKTTAEVVTDMRSTDTEVLQGFYVVEDAKTTTLPDETIVTTTIGVHTVGGVITTDRDKRTEECEEISIEGDVETTTTTQKMHSVESTTSTIMDSTHHEYKTTSTKTIESIEGADLESLLTSGELTIREEPVIIERSEIVRTLSDESKSSLDGIKSPEEIFSTCSSGRKGDSEMTKTDVSEVILRKHKRTKEDTSSSSSNLKPDRKSGIEFEAYSSSGESHYQSFEIDSAKSRPCSSDVEGLVAAGSSEYESALTSQDLSAPSNRTSNEYHTAVSSLSSKESMKSLDSESSGHMASVEISEASETLVPSEFDLAADGEQNLDDDFSFGQSHLPTRESTDMSDPLPIDTQQSIDISEEDFVNDVNEIIDTAPKMKRSQEMTFQPEPKTLVPDSPQFESMEMEERLGTSLDDGSVLSVSLSSTSSIAAQRTVIELSHAESDRFDLGMSISHSSEDNENAESASSMSPASTPIATNEMSTSTHADEQQIRIDNVTLTTSCVDENGIQSVSTQVISQTHTPESEKNVVDVFESKLSEPSVTEPKKRGHRRNDSTSFMSSIVTSFSHVEIEQKLHGNLKDLETELSHKEGQSDEKKEADEKEKEVEKSEMTEVSGTDMSRYRSQSSLDKIICIPGMTSESIEEHSDIEELDFKDDPAGVDDTEQIKKMIKEIATDKKSHKEVVEKKDSHGKSSSTSSEKSSFEEAEAEAAFSMVPHISPAHKIKQICPILEDEDAEKHELETRERSQKEFEERKAQMRDQSPGSIPDIKVTQHMTPMDRKGFHYPDLELEENEEEPQMSTPQTPASNSSKSSESTDQGHEYVLDETQVTIPEESESQLQEEGMAESKCETVVEKTMPYEADRETASPTESPNSDSFELVEKPDLIDEFVVIEEVAKEAHETDMEGQSVRISKTKVVKRHDEEVENYLVRSAPSPATKMTEIKYYPEGSSSDELGFEFEDSPPTANQKNAGVTAKPGSSPRDYVYEYDRELEANKKWIEQQFQGDQAAMIAAGYGYEMEFERCPLEDIKEEDVADFDSSRIGSLNSHKGSVGSFKDSYSSTPEYDVLAGRKYFTKSGEHDDISMSSLQEFENLERAMSLENRRMLQGSQDSSSNGSFKTRYFGRSGQGDDISVNSLKEFEGLEKACIAVHKVETKVKEEELLLAQIDEGQESTASETASCDLSVTDKKGTAESDEEDYEKRMFEIDEIIRQAQCNVERFSDLKDGEKTESIGRGDSVEEVSKVPDLDLDVPIQRTKVQWGDTEDIMLASIDSLDSKEKRDCHGSTDSLDQKTPMDIMTASTDSIEMQAQKSKGTIMTDSIEVKERSCVMTSSDSLELATGNNVAGFSDSIDEDGSRIGVHDQSSSSTGKDCSSTKDELGDLTKIDEAMIHSTDSFASTSTATHATYQYESDSVFSGSFTSGGSNTMVSSTDNIEQTERDSVSLSEAVRKVWFGDETVLDDSKPYVTEVIEPGTSQITRYTFKGPNAEQELKQFVEEFGEGEELHEERTTDADGNVHIKRTIERRVILEDDGSCDKLFGEATVSRTDQGITIHTQQLSDSANQSVLTGESSSSQSTVGSRPTKVEKDEKDETTDTSEGRQTEIYDQHQLSEEMKELLKDLEKESKK